MPPATPQVLSSNSAPSLPPPDNTGNLEVTSNYVASAVAPQTNPGQPVQTAAQPAVPQYEVVPERPGPDYVWHDGYWTWQGTWVWAPGQWIYRPPPVMIVPGGGFYYHQHFGGPRWRYGRPGHHRWR
ncbi:MAG TPA: hypothetical protein VK633_04090 [Verrucomicrobiae bacterium]|nr:hypothetical protein [Verrucomicrobiae bacterium]